MAKNRMVSVAVRPWDVVDILRREAGARTVLQIVTPTTSGEMVQRPELVRFECVTTLRYAVPEQRHDVPWSMTLPTLDELAASARRSGIRADIVFVDPWHSYADSCDVLLLALELVTGGGHVIVHDCDPPDSSHVVAAAPLGSPWCGETWRAFVDVTGRLPVDWQWWTIDADYGIGVIAVPASKGEIGVPALRGDVKTVPETLSPDQAWNWLQTGRDEILRIQDSMIWSARCARPGRIWRWWTSRPRRS